MGRLRCFLLVVGQVTVNCGLLDGETDRRVKRGREHAERRTRFDSDAARVIERTGQDTTIGNGAPEHGDVAHAGLRSYPEKRHDRSMTDLAGPPLPSNSAAVMTSTFPAGILN